MKILKINSFPINISIWTSNTLTSILLIKKRITEFNYRITLCIYIIYTWINKIFKKRTSGKIRLIIKDRTKKRFILFILAEIFLFTGIFWIFFHRIVSPTANIGRKWPPNNLIWIIDPLSTPLLMSLILLISGFSITISHHFLIKKNIKKTKKNFLITLKLRIIFLISQIIEYSSRIFQIKMSFNDSIYGNSFFFATTLHGSHVLIGTIFLIYSNKKIKSINKNNLINFEISNWYWHFVDLIWIFVYSSIYWWNT